MYIMYVCMYRSAETVRQFDQRSSFVVSGQGGVRGVVPRIESELDEAIQRQLFDRAIVVRIKEMLNGIIRESFGLT